METIYLNKFDGGMTNDPRDPGSNRARILKHFDAYTNPHKLTPYRSAVSGDSSASTHKIANILYANGILYGLGTIDATGSGGPANELALYKMTDLTTATWTADSHSTVPTGSIPASNNRSDAETAAFCYYPTTGKIYGVLDGRYVWHVTPGTNYGGTDADLTSYTNTSNMLVHSKDDCLYLGYDNKIAKNNNGTWTVAALTLPVGLVITSICEYGNYLAIGCRSTARGRSKVFLWNRDDSLTTLSESIDWGDGELYMLEELEGHLIGVSFAYVTAGTTLDSQFMVNTRVSFRYYAGQGGAVQFEEFVGASTANPIRASIALAKQKVSNRILFPACIPIGTTGYEGIWSIGRDSQSAPFSVALDRLINNGTTVSSIYGFRLVGDYMFAAYATSGTFGLDKTDSSASYTATSVLETTINLNMPIPHRTKSKQLAALALATEPLTSGQQAVLKYRVDGSAWKSVFTTSTVGATVTEQAFDANGDPFTAGREYEFHIESTGGAEITGLIYKYNVLTTDI